MPDRGVCRLGHGAYSSVKSAPFWQGVGLCCSASLRCLPGPWQSLKVPAPVRQPRRVQDDAGPVALARAPPRAPAPARRPPIRRLPASKPACTTQCYTRSPNPAWNPTSVSLRLELHCHQGRGGARLPPGPRRRARPRAAAPGPAAAPGAAAGPPCTARGPARCARTLAALGTCLFCFFGFSLGRCLLLHPTFRFLPVYGQSWSLQLPKYARTAQAGLQLRVTHRDSPHAGSVT